jgi:hypothetical protein
MSVGAAIAAARVADDVGLTVSVIGTPADERGGCHSRVGPSPECTIDELDAIRPKVMRCFEAGAPATGAAPAIRDTNAPSAEVRHHAEIAVLYRRNAASLGRAFPDVGRAFEHAAGSTEMGNMSQVMPSIRWATESKGHSPQRPMRTASAPEPIELAEPTTQLTVPPSLGFGSGLAWRSTPPPDPPAARGRSFFPAAPPAPGACVPLSAIAGRLDAARLGRFPAGRLPDPLWLKPGKVLLT